MSMQIKQSRPFVGFSDKTITANLRYFIKLAVLVVTPVGLQIYKIIQNLYNILQKK